MNINNVGNIGSQVHIQTSVVYGVDGKVVERRDTGVVVQRMTKEQLEATEPTKMLRESCVELLREFRSICDNPMTPDEIAASKVRLMETISFIRRGVLKGESQYLSGAMLRSPSTFLVQKADQICSFAEDILLQEGQNGPSKLIQDARQAVGATVGSEPTSDTASWGSQLNAKELGPKIVEWAYALSADEEVFPQ